MNNFCTLEQARRLKAAGWTAETEYICLAECSTGRAVETAIPREYVTDIMRKTGEYIAVPSAAEIMEVLPWCKVFRSSNGWSVNINCGVESVNNPDLLDALVEAYVKSKEDAK